jgi:hypothetical protein
MKSYTQRQYSRGGNTHLQSNRASGKDIVQPVSAPLWALEVLVDNREVYSLQFVTEWTTLNGEKPGTKRRNNAFK